VPQVPRRLNQHRDHLIVCGDDALAYRVVEELTVNYGERVTALLSSAARGNGPRIAQLPGVRVIERPELDTEAFTAAQAQSARAMALTRQDDRGKERPLSGHVIVAGLGNVGSRIAGQLHDLGVGVVCVDKNEHAAGVRLARRLGLRVVIGETHREETLRAGASAPARLWFP
jgi:hypothetical protein